MSGTEIAWRVFAYVVASAGYLGFLVWRKRNPQFVRKEGMSAIIAICGTYCGAVLWPAFDLGGWWQIAGAAFLMGTILGLSLGVFPWLMVKLGKWGIVKA